MNKIMRKGDEISTPDMPANMREVSKTEFFSLLKADQRDIMPRLPAPNHVSWELNNHPGHVWGWTIPGWKFPNCGVAERYAVVRS